MSRSYTTDGEYMAELVKQSGHEWDDFFIFSATGTDDFAYSAFKAQIMTMGNVTDGTFRFDDNECEGNPAYLEREGYVHDGTAIGLGCMGMSHAYGAPADKKEMTKRLAQVMDMGYTFFDTAEVYGAADNPHDNEELVGTALKPYRDKIVLATKFGIRFDMSSTAVNKPFTGLQTVIYQQVCGRIAEALGNQLYRPLLSAPSEFGCAGVMSELI